MWTLFFRLALGNADCLHPCTMLLLLVLRGWSFILTLGITFATQLHKVTEVKGWEDLLGSMLFL